MVHKHKDLIIAWANGASIEFLNTFGEWQSILKPGWDEDTEYRIKPEPKPDTSTYVNVYPGGNVGDGYSGLEQAKLADSRGMGIGRIKLTLDGETGAFKSVEKVNV